MKLFVTIGPKAREVTVEGNRVTVDGVAYEASLVTVPGTPLCRLEVGGRYHLLSARSLGQGDWEVLDRGERIEVNVLDERTRHIRGLVGQGKRHAGSGAIRAPMPGLVTKVLVSGGERVVAGTGLVVLEAMKMENQLTAPGKGVVRRVAVQAGQTVEKGEVLVELEEGPSPSP
jgi:pyruvate carboxylase subunit B